MLQIVVFPWFLELLYWQCFVLTAKIGCSGVISIVSFEPTVFKVIISPEKALLNFLTTCRNCPLWVKTFSPVSISEIFFSPDLQIIFVLPTTQLSPHIARYFILLTFSLSFSESIRPFIHSRKSKNFFSRKSLLPTCKSDVTAIEIFSEIVFAFLKGRSGKRISFAIIMFSANFVPLMPITLSGRIISHVRIKRRLSFITSAMQFVSLSSNCIAKCPFFVTHFLKTIPTRSTGLFFGIVLSLLIGLGCRVCRFFRISDNRSNFFWNSSKKFFTVPSERLWFVTSSSSSSLKFFCIPLASATKPFPSTIAFCEKASPIVDTFVFWIIFDSISCNVKNILFGLSFCSSSIIFL